MNQIYFEANIAFNFLQKMNSVSTCWRTLQRRTSKDIRKKRKRVIPNKPSAESAIFS